MRDAASFLVEGLDLDLEAFAAHSIHCSGQRSDRWSDRRSRRDHAFEILAPVRCRQIR